MAGPAGTKETTVSWVSPELVRPGVCVGVGFSSEGITCASF